VVFSCRSMSCTDVRSTSSYPRPPSRASIPSGKIFLSRDAPYNIPDSSPTLLPPEVIRPNRFSNVFRDLLEHVPVFPDPPLSLSAGPFGCASPWLIVLPEISDFIPDARCSTSRSVRSESSMSWCEFDNWYGSREAPDSLPRPLKLLPADERWTSPPPNLSHLL